MAFTYDPTKLLESKLFQVRLRTGQTTESGPVTLSDEEIEYLLDIYNDNVLTTSVAVLNSQIAFAASNLVDRETGQVSESLSQVLDNLKKLKDDLESSSLDFTPKYACITGIFNDDMKAVDEDSTVYQDGAKLDNKGIDKKLMNDILEFSTGDEDGETT